VPQFFTVVLKQKTAARMERAAVFKTKYFKKYFV
jgi:hypothetical protein